MNTEEHVLEGQEYKIIADVERKQYSQHLSKGRLIIWYAWRGKGVIRSKLGVYCFVFSTTDSRIRLPFVTQALYYSLVERNCLDDTLPPHPDDIDLLAKRIIRKIESSERVLPDFTLPVLRPHELVISQLAL